MYSVSVNQKVDINKEIKVVIDFTLKHWDIKNKDLFKEMVEVVFQYGETLSKNNFEITSFEHYLRDILYPNKNYEKKEHHFNLYQLEYTPSKIGNALNKQIYYDTYMPILLKKIKGQFPELKNLKPKEWIKYKNNPEAYGEFIDYPNDEVSPEQNNFLGLETTYLTFIQDSYPRTIARGSVLYNDERSRKPFETLLRGLINQSILITMQNNTADMINELVLMYETSLNDTSITFETATPLIYNPTLKSLFEHVLLNRKVLENREPPTLESIKSMFKSMLNNKNVKTKKQKEEDIEDEAILKKVIEPLIVNYNEKSKTVKNK